ncbi:HlyD family secretion protein [Gillisia sp. Hel_I_86]|uniref:efflux RND transporter periplasmic adaptor subunit n=1 Tax=Gillisia sp. Hel_I_86 TaxID=1249981 RepID=UPI001198EB76|nr:HlyD family efflux transporter periplasmic adaptor subunit [Gillisia sp. Hel_I_86]TVZ27688.1 HlyD family secretion protein [Gillisia sp. Hel_I_86]
MTGKLIKSIYIPVFIMFFLACKNKVETTSGKKAAITVETTLVQQSDIKEYLTFNGVSKYQKKENIRANVTGYISRMNFKIGDRINKGQLFASVRTKEQDALKDAVKIDSSLSKFISPIVIRSNVSGVISELKITSNDYIAEGDILASVVQPKSLVIQVNVPYEYEDYVSIGTLCEIVLQNEETIIAKITGSLPTIDPVAQAQIFLIALPDTDLPENLNVQVRTVYREAVNALSIPNSALQTNELLTEYWVMKVVQDSLAIKQKVIPMLRNDSLVQIAPGLLKVNDIIITEGAYQMQDSTIVSKSN